AEAHRPETPNRAGPAAHQLQHVLRHRVFQPDDVTARTANPGIMLFEHGRIHGRLRRAGILVVRGKGDVQLVGILVVMIQRPDKRGDGDTVRDELFAEGEAVVDLRTHQYPLSHVSTPWVGSVILSRKARTAATAFPRSQRLCSVQAFTTVQLSCTGCGASGS